MVFYQYSDSPILYKQSSVDTNNNLIYLRQRVLCYNKNGLWLLLAVIVGACRDVSVPRQDLAMPHLMHKSGKRIYFITALNTIYKSLHV